MYKYYTFFYSQDVINPQKTNKIFGQKFKYFFNKKKYIYCYKFISYKIL